MILIGWVELFQVHFLQALSNDASSSDTVHTVGSTTPVYTPNLPTHLPGTGQLLWMAGQEEESLQP